MKNKKITWLVIGTVFVALGIGGLAFANPAYNGNTINIYSSGMMGGWNGGIGNGHMSGMMGSWNRAGGNINQNEEKIDIEEMKEIVGEYIASFDDNLEIGDMFIYEDTDYYVSIEEKDTGKGAMELLVNPYTGNIYPEFGPNMMWNQKYGMHGAGGFGMMGMGEWNGNTVKDSGDWDIDKIDQETAVALANVYIKDSLGEAYTVENSGHEFYGYYTFHVDKGEETVGMLSVNYETGNVWFHEWHGILEKVVSGHEA